MPKLSPEQRQARLKATKEAAAALLEDIEYLRETVAKPNISRADVRRMSGTLRRFLVDGDLANIAGPRLGTVRLLTPDNSGAYKANKDRPFIIFAGPRAIVLGKDLRVFMLFNVPNRGAVNRATKKLNGYSATLMDKVDLDLLGFLKQRVICYNGQWATRKAVIKYVANVASGVHSGSINTNDPEEVLLNRVRKTVHLRKQADGKVHIEPFPSGFAVDTASFLHTPDALDFVLVEVLATAHHLVQSPFIGKLEEFIREELSASAPAPRNILQP